MNVLFIRLSFILNNEVVNHRMKKFWKLLLLYLGFFITIASLPGSTNFYMYIAHASTIFLFGKVVIDKGNLLNSLSMSNDKKVIIIYTGMATMILAFNLMMGIIFLLLKISTRFNEEVMEYRYNSLKEFTAFLILYLILFFFTSPLCFINKNKIWFAWFFGSSTFFIVLMNLLKMSADLNQTIFIGLVILVPIIFISFKASCYFNRPKRYNPLQNQPKSITI